MIDNGGCNGAFTTDPTWAQLRVQLASLQVYMRQPPGLPPTCRQLLDEIVANMNQVISFAAGGGHADDQLRSVQVMLTDYLPMSLLTYAQRPGGHARGDGSPDGTSPAAELESQLRLLRDGAVDAATVVTTRAT